MANEYYNEHKEMIDTLIASRNEIRENICEFNNLIEGYNKKFRKLACDEVKEFLNTLQPNTDKYDLVALVYDKFSKGLLADNIQFEYHNNFTLWMNDHLKKWFKVYEYTSKNIDKPFTYILEVRKVDGELGYVDIPNSLYTDGIRNDEELSYHALLNLDCTRALKVAELNSKELLNEWKVVCDDELVKTFSNEDDAVEYAQELRANNTTDKIKYIEIDDCKDELVYDF